MDLIKRIVTAFDVPYFVETGTAGGESVRVAASMFEKCWTIELIQERYEANIHWQWPSNISFLHGDSVEFLPELAKGFKKEYALYWLDAHYSDNKRSEEGVIECPLLQEIEAIATKYSGAILLIDDARLFLGPPPWPNDPRQWPRIEEIFATIKKNYEWHYTTIVDDYIVSLPDPLKDVLDKEWTDNYHKRYPSMEDRLKTEVKNVYEHLMRYLE